MALFDHLRPVAALSVLLDREKAALLKSDFKTLESLMASKETLLPLVAKCQIPEHRLRDLKRRAEQNRVLLLASAKGITSAVESLRSLRQASRSCVTYGPAGKALDIGNKSLTIKTKI